MQWVRSSRLSETRPHSVYLNSSARCRNVSFNSCRKVCSSEFLLLSLSALDYRNCEKILVDTGIEVENVMDLNTLYHNESDGTSGFEGNNSPKEATKTSRIYFSITMVVQWCSSSALYLQWVRLSTGQSCIATLGKLFTPVSLSPNSITWYRSKNGNILLLGR